MDKAFQAATETAQYKWNQAMVSAHVSLDQFGAMVKDMVLPVLENLVNMFQKLSKWFFSLDESQKKVLMTILAIVTAAGPLTYIFGKMLTVVGSLIKFYGKLAKQIVTMRTAFASLNVAMATNPIMALLSVLGAAAAALFLFRNRTKEAKTAQEGLSDAVEDVNAALGRQMLETLMPQREVDWGNDGFFKEAEGAWDSYYKNLQTLREHDLRNLQNYLESEIKAIQVNLSDIDPNDLMYSMFNDELQRSQKLLDGVNARLKLFENAGKSGLAEVPDYLKKINSEFSKAEQYAKLYENTLLADKINVVNSVIKELIDKGFKVAGKEIQNIITKYREFIQMPTAPPKLEIPDYETVDIEMEQATAVLGEMNRKYAEAATYAKVFGNEQTLLQDKLAAVDDAMRDLISQGFDEHSEAVQNLKDEYEYLRKQLMLLGQPFNALNYLMEQLSTTFKDTAMEGAESFQEFASTMLNSVRDIIGGMIAQGVAAMVSGALKDWATKVPFGYLLAPAAAAVAGGLAKTAFNSLIPAFESGGIVPGVNYSGDNILARVNSGEMIINKIQQARLMQMISAGGSSSNNMNGEVRFKIKYDYLEGVLVKGRSKRNLIGG